MGLNTTAAQVQIAANVTGTSQVDGLKKSLDGTNQSVAELTKKQQSFLAQLERLTQTTGKSRSENLAYKASLLGMGDAVAPTIAKLKQLGIDGAHGMGELSFATAGARRELLVIAHELATGNFKKAAGSAMVLGERINIVGMLFSGAGVSMLGAGAALIAFAAAAVQGARESRELQNSLTLTGNFAGITEGQFNRLAGTIAQGMPQGIGAAREALQGLVSTGRFTGDQLVALGKDVELVAHYTGQTAEEVVKDFAKMGDGVAKWAEQHNQQYHFLTAAQYAYIVQLEQQGQTEQAEQVVADALYKHLGTNAVENLGYLEQAWRGVGKTISEAWDAMKGFGRETTVDQQIANLAAKKKRSEDGSPMGFNSPDNVWTKDDDAAMARLVAQRDAQQKAAKQKSDDGKTQQKGIEGLNALNDKWRVMSGSVNLADREIKQFHRDLDAALKANPSDKDALDAQAHSGQIETAIRKKYDKVDFKAGAKLENRYQDRRQSLLDEGGKLDGEISQLERYGRVLDSSRLAVLNLDIAQGKLKGLSSDQIATLRQLAAGDDAKQRTLNGDKAFAGGEARAKAIAAEAQARTISNREAQIAAELAPAEAAGLAKTSDKYRQLERDIRAAVNARADSQLAAKLKEQDAQTDLEIEKLQQETLLMGKNSVARQKLVADMKIQAEAEKLIIANPDQRAQIQADADARKSRLNGAIDANYASGRSGATGARNAFQDYVDQSTDSAKQVQQIWSDAFNGTDKTLETFLEGGKVDFKSFADSIIKDMLHMAVEQAIMAPMLKMLGGALGFTGAPAAAGGMQYPFVMPHANGGVFGPGGSVPLSAYSSGGVANSPQLALFGEGRKPEAYVPLPDGRSIPVNMRGGSTQQQAGHVFQTSVVVNSDGSAQATGQQQGQGYARVIQQAVQQELMRQQRDGGMFSSTRGF